MMKFLLRRQINLNNNENIVFNRYLSLTNLIFLCISSSIGSGIYVLTGNASNQYAGQLIPLSYIIAAIPCFLAALCYAEFSSRVFASGSGYSFVYYSLGEIFAFIIGWTNIVASIAAFSAISLSWSRYFDAMLNNQIKNFTVNTLNLHWNSIEPFNNYIDIPAICILTIIFIISFFGIEFTAFLSNILAIINTILLLILTIFGFVYGTAKNLTQVSYNNGLHGIISGASIVLYAYMGFESSTCAITEAKNPSRDVPLSMLISLTLICVLYSSVSFSLNFMQNYTLIDKYAPFPIAFKNIKWMHLIASLGPVFSLTGTLLTAVFGFGRVIYAMSNDGLFFKSLSVIHKKYKVPHFALIFGYLFSILLLIILDLKDLLGFADLCGFLSYVSVSTALLIVRYTISNVEHLDNNIVDNNNEEYEIEDVVYMKIKERKTILLEEINEPLLSEFDDPDITIKQCHNRLNNTNKKYFRFKNKKQQQKFSFLIIFFTFLINMFLSGIFNSTDKYDFLIIIIIIIINILSCLLLIIFCEQNIDKHKIVFKVPFGPLIPIASQAMNLFLMMSTSFKDWIVFISIIILGLPIYIFYGIKNSKLA